MVPDPREPQPPTLPPRAREGRVGADEATAAAVEQVARTLLRRYGVVFWRLLTQEASWLPPWRDLLRVYRRLEARARIRGGRFVAGFSANNTPCRKPSVS